MIEREDGIVVRPPTPADFESILDLRWQVLDEVVGSPRQESPSAADLRLDVIHVAAFDNDRAISTVRVDPYPSRGEKIVLVRKMATDPAYQRRRIGTDVLRLAEELAAQAGATEIVLHARLGAVAFYEALGYQHNGRTEVHDGVETPEMIKCLAKESVGQY